MRAEASGVNTSSGLELQKRRIGRGYRWFLTLLLGASCGLLHGQICQTATDMDAPVRGAIEAAAKRYFDMSAHGDIAGLKQNSIPTVAANFAGIEYAVKEDQASFTGAQAIVRPPYLLSADGTAPLARAEFLCGVFGANGQTKNSAEFILTNLPPGMYAFVILDVTGGRTPTTLSLVLQQVSGSWKLAGYNARPSQVAGHDADWFVARAREYKAKSQNHDAWLYYREAIALSAPVDFMSTLATDKLYDELQSVQPADFPVNGSTIDLSAGGKTYRVTDIFPLAVGNDLDVVIRYQAADISDTARTFQENTAVIKALLMKFPELREAFAGVVARAVDPSGRDYGTLLAMKDIK